MDVEVSFSKGWGNQLHFKISCIAYHQRYSNN